ncbi:hypothetical protein ARAM_005216 [Aspergillus rambellii]|uniref:Ubiquitin-like-conjugating enzyme ATG10 n=2 Tax=Aspergillus subgen. Nidulantes TaxID=2720870 RepID=A0A0F8XC65_9EURO|nr:hypothetical protein AOCH_002757 [Aspergillus ochraceoroseus]KKK21172.1 hypothetical protein ARAM_005216 [Aspergillus rambellii]
MAATAAPPPLSSDLASLSTFPFLTPDEFQGACRAFLHRVHVVGLAKVGWLSIQLQATGPILKISQSLGGSRTSPEDDSVIAFMDAEDSQFEAYEAYEEDPEALVHTSNTCETLQVDYDVLLSPTYQVPVLYFILRQVGYPKPLGIDEVYRYLVPDQYRKEIQSVGIMGGISFGYHPISGTPAFFVHPCNTADAMRHIADRHSISPEAYLIMWLGLVGNCLRLHLPSELFAAEDISQPEGIRDRGLEQTRR